MQNEYISNLTATTWWSKNTNFFLIKYFRCVRFVTIRDFWHLLRSTGRLLLEISQLVVCPVSLWLIFADTTTVSWKIKGCGERYNCRWKWKWFFFIKKVSRIVLVVGLFVSHWTKWSNTIPFIPQTLTIKYTRGSRHASIKSFVYQKAV